MVYNTLKDPLNRPPHPHSICVLLWLFKLCNDQNSLENFLISFVLFVQYGARGHVSAGVYHFKFTSKVIRIAHVNAGKFYDMELVSSSLLFFHSFQTSNMLVGLAISSSCAPSSSRIVHGKLVQKTWSGFFVVSAWTSD